MVRAGLLLSVSLATLFAPRASATTAPKTTCESCLDESGTFCSYQTSGAGAEAAYGICYKTALGHGEACPDTYGALTDTYAEISVTLEAKSFDDNDCSEAPNVLTDANSVTFADLTDGDVVTGIVTCSDCVDGGNTWCQPKSKTANLAGGYCAEGQTVGVSCMELLLVDDFDSMKKINTADDCTTSPDDPCTTCLSDSKVFCAYSTGTTVLYHACIDASTTDCPPMTGIDDIYSGLEATTTVTAEMVDTRTDCPSGVPENADLDLDANLDMTVKTTCSDCISSEGKWCSYDATTVKGGYCGVNQKCAKLEDFANTSISNVPETREPTTDCDSPSAGFALTSSSIALATCAAALAISA